MRKETIFEMTSPCRDNFRITGYHFGNGEKTIAIVGAMRGDEVQHINHITPNNISINFQFG